MTDGLAKEAWGPTGDPARHRALAELEAALMRHDVAALLANCQPATRHLNLRGIFWKAGEVCVGASIAVLSWPWSSAT